MPRQSKPSRTPPRALAGLGLIALVLSAAPVLAQSSRPSHGPFPPRSVPGLLPEIPRTLSRPSDPARPTQRAERDPLIAPAWRRQDLDRTDRAHLQREQLVNQLGLSPLQSRLLLPSDYRFYLPPLLRDQLSPPLGLGSSAWGPQCTLASPGEASLPASSVERRGQLLISPIFDDQALDRRLRSTLDRRRH